MAAVAALLSVRCACSSCIMRQPGRPGCLSLRSPSMDKANSSSASCVLPIRLLTDAKAALTLRRGGRRELKAMLRASNGNQARCAPIEIGARWLRGLHECVCALAHRARLVELAAGFEELCHVEVDGQQFVAAVELYAFKVLERFFVQLHGLLRGSCATFVSFFERGGTCCSGGAPLLARM